MDWVAKGCAPVRCRTQAHTSRAIAVRDRIGAERGTGQIPVRGSTVVACRLSCGASTAHQPDDEHADCRRNDAGNAQSAIRHAECGCHGLLGSQGKSSKQNTLDREEQSDRGEEVGHPAEPAPSAGATLRNLYFAAGAGEDPGDAGFCCAGGAGVSAFSDGACPVGEEK